MCQLFFWACGQKATQSESKPQLLRQHLKMISFGFAVSGSFFVTNNRSHAVVAVPVFEDLHREANVGTFRKVVRQARKESAKCEQFILVPWPVSQATKKRRLGCVGMDGRRVRFHVGIIRRHWRLARDQSNLVRFRVLLFVRSTLARNLPRPLLD